MTLEKQIAEDYGIVLKEAQSMGCNKINALYNIPLDNMKAIVNALEEVQKYREIGTLEECRASMEKQKAKKPDFEGDGYADGHLVYDTWICPCCGKHYEVDYDDYDFCPNCGQKLDWSDEE